MAPALLNDTAIGGGATSGTTTGALTIPATAANSVLVVLIGMGTAATPSTSVSSISGGGGTWTKLASDNPATRKNSSEIWWTAPAAGTTSVTVNFAGTAGWGGHILEWGGCNTTAPFDVGGGTDGSSAAAATPTVTTSSASQALVAIVNQGLSSATVSGGTAGWTVDAQQTNHPTSIAAMTSVAYQIVSSAGAYSFGLTISSSTSWSACIATLRAAPGGGTPYLIQTARSDTSGVAASGTYSATFQGGTTAGSLLVAYSSCQSAATVPTPPGGWTTVWSDADSTNTQAHILAILPNCAAGVTSVTFTNPSGSSLEFVLLVAEFGGLTASPLDVSSPHSVGQTATTTPSLTASSTLAQPLELVIGAWMDEASTNTWTAGSGFTQAAQIAGSLTSFLMEWKVVTTTSAPVVSATNSVSHIWGGGVATFKAWAPPPPPLPFIALQAVQRASNW